MVRMVRLPQCLPPLREAPACRGPVLIPRQAAPFRYRGTDFCVAAKKVRRAVSSVGSGLSVGGLRVSARPHGPQVKKVPRPMVVGRGCPKKGLSVMSQITTSETVALSAPVLEGLRRLDQVMRSRRRQTAAQKRVALARSRARAALQAKEDEK